MELRITKAGKSTLRRILLSLLLFLVTFPQIALSQRPEYNGIALAYPKSSELPVFKSTQPFLQGERFLDIVLSIDKTGQVLSVKADQPADSMFAIYLASSITSLVFEPAVNVNAPTECNLPVILSMNPRFRRTEVVYPVNADLKVKSSSLYFRALEMNEVSLPKLKMFPAYFCNVKRSDSLERLPFVLEKLAIDSAGGVSGIESVASSLPSYAAQIQSACLWAEFSPLVISGKARASDCFLAVSFIPQLQYPSDKLVVDDQAERPWYDSWRVRVLADTIGLMTPPLPSEHDISKFTMVGRPRSIFGDVSALLMVDTLGNVRVRSTDKKEPKFHQDIVEIAKRLSFFPAMDFHGSPRVFEGTARFHFRNSKTVRIDYLWLD